ncbi:uncharacterized protein F5147DRAFT_759064 [Suillus discolor]|uniref:Uncharacterized protein n=1 Tax=Suillus discolor TaxID=1912936 RepID=A0A9P7JXP9_9AGAM|nr:uncharacterized protein F5147DRAFT_759064 [Suillus discolor]KAG2113819.1 hypothetical protein F5147DRAFT_759064 [Suillus discolor]
MSEDHRQELPPEAYGSREATAGESSSQHRSGCGFGQALRKVKKNVTKKVSKRFKRSCRQVPVVQNVDHQGASSNHNIEDASRLHPSDGDKPVTSENLSGCMDQGASGEPAPKVLDVPPGVEEIPDSQLVDAELRGAREGTESMRLLGGHVTSVVSKAEDGPKDLAAADDFQTTYLQPLKIFCH